MSQFSVQGFGLKAHAKQLQPARFPLGGDQSSSAARPALKRPKLVRNTPSSGAAPRAAEGDDDDASDAPEDEPLEETLARLALPDAARLAGRYAIPHLYAWQREALFSDPATLEGGSLVYAAPASGGKTTVAELLIAKALWRRRKRRVALYVVPLKSLVEEKVGQFAKLWSGDGSYGWRVRACHGDAEESRRARERGGRKRPRPPALVDDGDTDVAVLTWESASAFLDALFERGGAALVRERLACVVVDEVHLMSESQRGAVLESLLVKLLLARPAADGRRGDPQVVAMTATASNLPELAAWLRASLFRTSYRPTTLDVFVASPPLYAPGGECRELIREPWMPTLRRWDGAKLADVAAGWAVEARKVDDRRFANTDEALGAELCLAARGFVLAFAKTRRDAQDFAEKLAKWAPPPPAEHAKPLRAAAAALSRVAPPGSRVSKTLRACVRRGVAFHHAELTSLERDVVEGAIRDRLLRCCVATTTLSVGVNTPAARVVVLQLSAWCKAAELRQMCGRAGRKGFGDRGEAFVVCGVKASAARCAGLLAEDYAAIKSALAGDASLAPREADERRRVREKHYLDLVCSGAAKEGAAADVAFGFGADVLEAATLATLADLRFLRTAAGGGHEATPLGRAAHAAGLAPRDAREALGALACRRGIDYNGELHRCYLIAPLGRDVLASRADWAAFHDVLKRDAAAVDALENVVGGSLAYVRRRAKVAADAAHAHADTVALAAALAPASCHRVHERFCLALLLLDRVGSELPGRPFAERMGAACAGTNREDHVAPPKVSPGDVESYLADAAGLCRRLKTFCEGLHWDQQAFAVASMREKLARGAPDELMALMRASPRVNPTAARRLYDGGFDGAADLAAADAGAVAEILCRGAAFEEGAAADDAARGQASAIVADARAAVAADARADDASDDDGDGGDSDEDSLPDPDLVVASEDDE